LQTRGKHCSDDLNFGKSLKDYTLIFYRYSLFTLYKGWSVFLISTTHLAFGEKIAHDTMANFVMIFCLLMVLVVPVELGCWYETGDGEYLLLPKWVPKFFRVTMFIFGFSCYYFKSGNPHIVGQ
jgi:hypothetical protein